MRPPFIAAASLVLAASVAATAAAQEPIALSTGFTPDPVRVEGTAGGERPLNTMAAGCRGYVGDAPAAVFELESPFGFLRFFAVSPRDVTMAVRGPEGRWQCSGEPLGGAPREQGAFTPGRYEVWIGSAETGVEVPFELQITEFRSVTPLTGRLDEAAPVGGGAELGLTVDAEEGRFRDRRLRRGFLPDPREDGGRAGGEIDVAMLGPGCDGFVGARPSHVVELRTDFDYFRIQLGEAAGVATLVVRTPGGRWFCSSPDDVDAHVDQDAWPEGSYQIWVGAHEPDAAPDYRICYTEVRPAEGHVACGARGRRAPPAVRAPDPGVTPRGTAPDEPPADE